LKYECEIFMSNLIGKYFMRRKITKHQIKNKFELKTNLNCIIEELQF